MKIVREDNQAAIGRYGTLPLNGTFEWQGDLYVKDSSTHAIRLRGIVEEQFDPNTPVLRVDTTVTYRYVDFGADV